jgi:hypothetical protein
LGPGGGGAAFSVLPDSPPLFTLITVLPRPHDRVEALSFNLQRIEGATDDAKRNGERGHTKADSARDQESPEEGSSNHPHYVMSEQPDRAGDRRNHHES